MAQVFDTELDLFLHSPRGPIYRWLLSRTIQITTLAKGRAGKEDGRLSRSIRYSIERVPLGLEATVVAPVDYAYFHHEGTRPHIITPGPRHRFLRFRGAAGVQVFAEKVRHPGTRPNKFLTEPMELVLRRV